jgi:hypothetical protein
MRGEGGRGEREKGEERGERDRGEWREGRGGGEEKQKESHTSSKFSTKLGIPSPVTQLACPIFILIAGNVVANFFR